MEGSALPDTAGNSPEAAADEPTSQVAAKHRAKIYGEEREYSTDELIKLAQKAVGSDERFRQAAERDKARDAWLSKIKEDPWSVFKDLDLDPDTLAEERLLRKLRFETMSEEGKRAHKAEEALAEIKAEAERSKKDLEKSKKDLEEREYEELRSKYATELDDQLSEAFKSTGKTATPRRIARVVEIMIAHAEQRGDVLPVDKAIDMAEKEIHGDIREILSKLSAAELADILPRQARDGLRKNDLEELKRQNPLRQKSSQSSATNTAQRSRGFKGKTDDFFDKLTRKYK